MFFFFYFKVVNVLWDMFLKEGRLNVKKVFVVIFDKGFLSLDSEIRNEVKLL